MAGHDKIEVRRLRAVQRHLRIAHAGIAVAVMALRHQRADQDEEIAQVLRFCVGERLLAQIDRIEELIALLGDARIIAPATE